MVDTIPPKYNEEMTRMFLYKNHPHGLCRISPLENIFPRLVIEEGARLTTSAIHGAEPLGPSEGQVLV